MAEARKSPRKVLRYPAWIEVRPGVFSSCTVANVSVGGAQILLEEPVVLSTLFILWFTQTADLRRGCRVIWRKNDKVGVSFFKLKRTPPTAYPPATDVVLRQRA